MARGLRTRPSRSQIRRNYHLLGGQLFDRSDFVNLRTVCVYSDL